MKLIVLLVAVVAAGCKGGSGGAGPEGKDRDRVADAATARKVEPPPVEKPAPGMDLVGVWSSAPEIVEGKYHDVHVLRADGTFEWRASELECNTGLTRIVGTWKLERDRLVTESKEMTGWEGDDPEDDPKCERKGMKLTTTAQVELTREPVASCPAEIEYPGLDGVMTKAKVADLAYPCVLHGEDYRFRVATVEAYDAAHPVTDAVAPKIQPAAAKSEEPVLDCGCGCCGGVEPKVECVDRAKFDLDALRNKIAAEAAARKPEDCAAVGCSAGTLYKYCDKP
jgi:hypothetical protein